MALIAADFTGVEPIIKPLSPGVKKLRIDQAEVTEAKSDARKGKFNLTLTLSALDGDERKSVMSWTPTEKKEALLRVVLSAGLENPGSNGFDSDTLIGKDIVAMIKNELVDDQVTGGKVERSAIAGFLIPTDDAYATAV